MVTKELTSDELEAVGIGVQEERTIKIRVSASVDWLKGLEWDEDGNLRNQMATTDIGWMEELIKFRSAIEKNKEVTVLGMELI